MAKMLHLLLDWEYPHWMMMAGAILVAAGFIGLAFHRNRNAETDHEPPEMKASGKRDGRDSKIATLPPWPWRPPPEAR
jgi:hypothetical protein